MEIVEVLTVHEVAQQLRVDETTVRRWIKQGTLEAIRLPHRGPRESFRIKKHIIDEMMNPVTPDIL